MEPIRSAFLRMDRILDHRVFGVGRGKLEAFCDLAYGTRDRPADLPRRCILHQRLGDLVAVHFPPRDARGI